MIFVLSLYQDHFYKTKATKYHRSIWDKENFGFLYVTSLEKSCSKEIWLKTLLIAYQKLLFQYKYDTFNKNSKKINALVKVFYMYIKIFLVQRRIKSIQIILSNILAVAKIHFLNLAKFAMIDKFLIFLPTSPLSKSLDVFRFF